MQHLCRTFVLSAAALAFSLSALNANGSTTAPGQNKSANLNPGTVSATINNQVAQYTWTLPMAATWFVNFGTTTSYGRSTAVQTVTPGNPGGVYVAGMLPNTTYHMQATATLPDGTTLTDVDHTFTAGSLPPGIPLGFPVTLGSGTPQPGIELINPLAGSLPSSVLATDLQGNVIWTYLPAAVRPGTLLFPAKLLLNGDLLLFLSTNSYPVDEHGSEILREIDLTGRTIRELSMGKLNGKLHQAGFPQVLENFTHDFDVLPNGHTLIITNRTEILTDLPGYPGKTQVVGDVVVDLDPDWKPVWVWDEFDHFDVNRHPMLFPDWTHTNSVAYSADDGNFIVSIRHQNWIVKVDYRNGQGSGNIVWKLGKDGDFALQGGVDPTDWFYAQHDAEFVGAKTAGQFTLSLMDNGDDRLYPGNIPCGSGQYPCYSTVQTLNIDEAAKTAAIQFHQVLPLSLYSGWGGNAEVLGNGDVEYNLSGPVNGSQVFEVTNGSNPQTVWNLYLLSGNAAYRAFRVPSLYPGVQW